MSVDVEVETIIHRPPEEVAAFAGDPGNAPRWYQVALVLQHQVDHNLSRLKRLLESAADADG